MKAQTLYDFRSVTGFCSGTDLHDFFAGEAGDPSPGGEEEVEAREALAFVGSCLDVMAANNGDDMQEHCRICSRLFATLLKAPTPQDTFSHGPFGRLVAYLGIPDEDDGHTAGWPCGCELHGETLFACDKHAKECD